MKLDVTKATEHDLCTITPNCAGKQYHNRKCEFIKITKAGLVEIQLFHNPQSRDSFPRNLIHEYIEYPRTFKYYNAEYEGVEGAIEFQSNQVELEDVAVEAAKLHVDGCIDVATIPVVIMLIDSKGVNHLFEVQIDITYDYYAMLIDY